MSTGKRLAKRSILGTRVCAPVDDGRFYPGVIQATKTGADDREENVYCVLFEDKSTKEYRSQDLVGPGFQNVTSVKLKSDQKIFVTHNGREVTGKVLHHRPNIDEVLLTIELSQQGGPPQSPLELKKKLEEVRLMESRKSARLQDLDTDYSRLADGQSESRRRASSFSIDIVPSHVLSVGRKRRPSADDDVMDDCMAAMVLMRLSCSPKSPRLPENGVLPHSWASSSSWMSSSGCSSHQDSPPRTDTPPSPLSLGPEPIEGIAIPGSNHPYRRQGGLGSGGGKRSRCGSPTEDEGIEMDESLPFMEEGAKNKQAVRTVVFQCTWPGCFQQYSICEEVEKHVRTQHLGKADNIEESDLTDHEEEFYYTEIEEEDGDVEDLFPAQSGVQPHHNPPLSPVSNQDENSANSFASIYISSAPTLSHLDMVRPPHEDPEYQRQIQISLAGSPASPINIPQLHHSMSWQPHGYAASAPGIMVSPQKFMRLSPKSLSSPLKGSPLHRKGRSESRKCRKVYGMENREMWCTQCKWKKACTRFSD